MPLLIALLLSIAAPVAAAPTVNCHCFQDRSFDPERPAAADPYLLATTQNSLLAAVYGLPKKEVVQARMSETSAEQLWVAHYLARQGKLPVETVAAARATAGNWPGAATALRLDPARLDPAVTAQLAGGGNEVELVAAIVDATLADRLGAPRGELKELRRAGAANQEAIASTVLGRRTGRPAPALLAEVRAGRASWGSLAAVAGLEPAAIGAAVAAMVH